MSVMRIIIICLVILAASFFLTRFDWDRDEHLIDVVVAQFGDFFLYAPLYVAIDASFMEEQGLKVRLVSTGGDETTWAAVLGRSAVFGVADPTFVAIAGDRGRPGRVVASLVEGVPFWGVTFDEEIPKGAGPDTLQGRTVATFPAPSTAHSLQERQFLDQELTPSIREGAPGALLPMLRAGAADIALELEPTVSQAVRDGGRVLYSLAEKYPDFAMTGVTVEPATLANNPELVASFVCALQLALDYIRMQPDSAIEILTKRFPEISRDVAEDALGRAVREGVIPETVVTTEQAWRVAVELRQNQGALSGAGEFDVFVNNDAASFSKNKCRLPQM